MVVISRTDGFVIGRPGVNEDGVRPPFGALAQARRMVNLSKKIGPNSGDNEKK